MTKNNQTNDPNTLKNLAKINAKFHAACDMAGLKITRRQYSKWVKHKGLAWQIHQGQQPCVVKQNVPAKLQIKLQP
jgi:hypothetical protein